MPRRRLPILLGVLLLLLLALAGTRWWRASAPAVNAAAATRDDREAPQTASARRAGPAPAVAPALPAPAPPADTPEGWVSCLVGRAFEGRSGVKVLTRGEGSRWVGAETRVEGGVLAFEPPAGRTDALLVWNGGGTEVRWADGRCEVDELPAPRDAAVFGRVRGAERLADGTVFLEGCGVDRDDEASAIDQDGGFYFPAEAGPCRVRAWRQHGALRLPGEWVEIDPAAGGEVDVDLDVPTFALAGMGIGFRPQSEGVVVETVHPGTPAFEAGLQPGDLITAINGQPTDGMDTEDFLYEGIGPAGTEVHVEGVSSEGEPFDSRFHRREIVLQ